jgi:hypothetical protein
MPLPYEHHMYMWSNQKRPSYKEIIRLTAFGGATAAAYENRRKPKYTECPGGKVDNLRGHSIGHSNQKSVYVHVSYPNGFRDRAISRYSSLYTV